MHRERFPARVPGRQSSSESLGDRSLAPGKRTLTADLAMPGGQPSSDARPGLQMLGIQRAATARPDGDQAHVHAAAARGTALPATRLPFGDLIQRAFGRHDISGIQAHVGAEAAASAHAMGAQAYATGDHVVLGQGADLHTAAHEAAHVIQQRGGVQLKGGVGEGGDAYERQADAVADLVVQGRSAEHLLDHTGGSRAAAGTPARGIQRKLVIDEIFTANTAKLGGQIKKLDSLKAVVALIEQHPLNKLMTIDVYVEGGKQDRSSKMGSTVVQSIDGKQVAKPFYEYVMTEQLIRSHTMQIGVKVNVEPDDYNEYEEDADYDDEESLGDMIATFLHEVQLHVLPKLDQLVQLKQADPGKDGKLKPETLKQLSPHMAQVMGASDIDDHDNPRSWANLLDTIEGVANELTRSDDQGEWDLASSAVMSVVNDVMTHTAPNPEELGLENLTPRMPPEQKKKLYLRADLLATTFKEHYSKKFPHAKDDGSSDEELNKKDKESDD